MASEEMLKKLLDEFVEKETFVSEELKLMSEQIVQLEARLDSCRARLSTIGADRDKVLSIRTRYSGSDGLVASSSHSHEVSAPFSDQPAAPIASPPTLPISTLAPFAQNQPGADSMPTLPSSPATNFPEPQAPVQAEPTTPRATNSKLSALISGRKPDGSSPPPPPPLSFSNSEVELPISSWESQLQPEPAPWQPAPEPQWATMGQESPTPQWEMAAADDAQGGAPSLPQSSQPAATQDADQGSTGAGDQSAESSEDGGNDTVKNINDALRSLFR